MSLLFNTLFAAKCKNTHHKLALDALRHLQHPQAEAWRNVFLTRIDPYLDGSKAPDDQFKDFRNHVLHVRDNWWGGAVAAAEKWYATAAEAFRNQQWNEAVFATGVVSHYVTDPIQPFHTGQSEAEEVVHRAAEWSIACAYEELRNRLEQELGGYPDITLPTETDWLKQLIHRGAAAANPHYETLIQHYNLELGRKQPPAGLDQESKDRIAGLIGVACVTFARVLDRLLAECSEPPATPPVSLMGVLTKLTVPVMWVTRRIVDVKERAAVDAMYREFQATGKVLETLSEDNRTVRAQHAEEVLRVPLAELDAQPVGPIGTAYGTGAPARPQPKPRPALSSQSRRPKAAAKPAAETTPSAPPLSPTAVSPTPTVPATVQPTRPAAEPAPQPAPEPAVAPPSMAPAPSPTANSRSKNSDDDHSSSTKEARLAIGDPLERAPGIGPKSAQRFARFGINTVQQLLDADPQRLAGQLSDRHFSRTAIIELQQAARLCCDVPGLYGHDAQILVACGIGSAAELAGQAVETLLDMAVGLAETPEGQRILRGSTPPDEAEVRHWIDLAQRGEPNRQAA